MIEEKHYCDCKCGEEIIINKWTNKYARFISGHNNKLRIGQTNIEVYGEKKAKIIKKRIRKDYNFVCKCGKEYILNLTLISFQKNKYRKYCSRKCANSHVQTKEQNESRRLKLKGRKNKYARKSLIEKVGEKRAKEINQKIISKLEKIKNINQIKETLTNVFKYESNVTKGKFYKNEFVKKELGIVDTIKRKLKIENTSLDILALELGEKFSKGNVSHLGGIGKNEIEVLNEHQKLNGLEDEPFLPQHPVGKYYVDRLYPGINKVVEDYEPYHNGTKQKIKDIIRQNEITRILGCSFEILDDREWMKKINNKSQVTLKDF